LTKLIVRRVHVVRPHAANTSNQSPSLGWRLAENPEDLTWRSVHSYWEWTIQWSAGQKLNVSSGKTLDCIEVALQPRQSGCIEGSSVILCKTAARIKLDPTRSSASTRPLARVRPATDQANRDTTCSNESDGHDHGDKPRRSASIGRAGDDICIMS
jgi:hypothetical protein